MVEVGHSYRQWQGKTGKILQCLSASQLALYLCNHSKIVAAVLFSYCIPLPLLQCPSSFQNETWWGSSLCILPKHNLYAQHVNFSFCKKCNTKDTLCLLDLATWFFFLTILFTILFLHCQLNRSLLCTVHHSQVQGAKCIHRLLSFSLLSASQFNSLSCCRYFTQGFCMGLEPSPAALCCNIAAACTQKTNVLFSIPIWSPQKSKYAVSVGMIEKDYKWRSP